MALSMRDLQLTAVNGIATDDMKDVRLLDSYEDRTEDNCSESKRSPCSTESKPHKIQLGQFTIGGMTCAACVNSVEGILRDLHGVKRAVVALATALGDRGVADPLKRGAAVVLEGLVKMGVRPVMVTGDIIGGLHGPLPKRLAFRM
ncbi:hypothetical protein LWI29_033376 [Acer saccharum]|uniref:HMA domain-containing protein n=1 Tax=Acer saccharum TaxID=4024 RepID=A0AA39SXP9_ACESA|nr:hypothetical protein LWI29_033376 [Acer saccharum]